MTLHRSLAPALIALVTLLGVGCKKKPKVIDPTAGLTAPEILRDGEIMMQRGNWEDGRLKLRLIEEHLPSSAEFPKAKMLIGESFFFAGTPAYAEALVEYQSFLNYFPRHEMRDYAQFRIGLCHFASIETAERDQTATQKALESFQKLVADYPGSPYVVDARTKITQCWRRLAEHELMIGSFYVNAFNYAAAERRLKELLETYPEYVDRERAYYFLAEALRRKTLSREILERFNKDFLVRIKREETDTWTKEENAAYKKELKALAAEETAKYRLEARGYYQKLVESYPKSEWAGRAKDRLVEMGTENVKEELDS